MSMPTDLTSECFLDLSPGGITLISEEGKIRLANTFESRLETTYESNLPYFRAALGFNEQVA